MELKSLAEVELRDATFPINRNAPSNFLPALRTAALLRDLIALGVLDASLSKVLMLSGKVVGCCLVERSAGGGLLSGLGIESLAQQRGGGRALLEGVIAAARAAKLPQLSVEVGEADSSQQALLHAVGFERRQTLCRMALADSPNRALLPPESSEPSAQPGVTTIAVETALQFLHTQPDWHPAPVAQPEVLRKLTSRLSCLAMRTGEAILAVLVVDKERKLIVTCTGETVALAALAAFGAVHHGVAFADSLSEDDPAVAALTMAGFHRLSLRSEHTLTLGTS